MASLCHPWFTTTNFSYRFPIFETSATALCGTTGKLTQLWKITILNGTIHYKWPCSIAFCMFTRGYLSLFLLQPPYLHLGGHRRPSCAAGALAAIHHGTGFFLEQPKWLVYNGKPIYKWMRTGSPHILGKPHISDPLFFFSIKSMVFSRGLHLIHWNEKPYRYNVIPMAGQIRCGIPGCQQSAMTTYHAL